MSFVHRPHPHIARRRITGPPRVADQHSGLNGRIAVGLTTVVGTMWCAYAFALLALVALPSAWNGGALTLVQWVSQTFIQLVLLSVIMVGQAVQALAADKRAQATFDDASACLSEAQEIQRHLADQDSRLDAIIKGLGT